MAARNNSDSSYHSSRTHDLTVLDLFSGPGGMSQGIKEAKNYNFRFNVIVANDYDKAVRLTYAKNHDDVEFVSGSIVEEETKKDIISAILKATGRSTVDMVVGGPPCKGFSLENKMTRNMKNPMNHLIMHYVEMVRRTKPVAFVMENVPGIFAMRHGKIIQTLIQRFQDMGYHNADAWLLNAADYGIPQARKRAFVVGSKSKIPLSRPIKTHGTKDEVKKDHTLLTRTSVADALNDLPRISMGKTCALSDMYAKDPQCEFQRHMRKKSHRVTNHVVTKNTPLVTKRIRTVPSGGNWNNIPVTLMKVRGQYKNLDAHSMIYRRLVKNEPSITITNFRKAMIIHPTQHRLLSVREAARIQTFPDHFEFEGGISNMQQQVSDAVPVQLAKKVGEVMLHHLHDVIKIVPVMQHARRRTNIR